MAIESVTIGGNGAGAQVAKKKYPIVKAGLYGMQLLDLTERQMPKFGKPDEKESKLSFEFIIVAPGKFYGSRFWKNVTPTLSRASGEGKSARKESNLHKLLKALINGGQDLSDEQIKAFQSDPVNMLNALIDPAHPDFTGWHFVDGYVKVENGKNIDPETKKPEQYNKLDDVSFTDETYEPYVAPPIELDPRNEGEDEEITCQFGEYSEGQEPCNRIIRGWPKSNGDWYSQEDWVGYQEEKYGGHYCGKHLKVVKEDLANPETAPF